MMALLLLVIVVLFYWKLTLTRQFDWGWGPDFATQVMPWFNEQARQWQSGQFPLWDPNMRGGQPFLGQAQPGAAYPLNWLLFQLPIGRDGGIKPGYLQGYFVVIHWMAAGFAYLLARRFGCSRAASVFAGVAFSFSGFLGSKNWPQMINGAVWTPLAFWFLAPGPRRWADAAISGAALGMAWLSGHHQIPLFVSFAVGGAWLWRCWADRREIRFAACAIAIGGLVGALQILPAQEYGRLAKRWTGVEAGLAWNQPVPLKVHARYSNSPVSALHVALPGGTYESDPFSGIAVVTLALLGLAAWRESAAPALAAIAMAGWIYSLGPATWLHGLFHALAPVAEKARTPAAANHLLSFGLAMLAAHGVDQVRAGSRWVRHARAALLAVSAVLVAAIYLAPQPEQSPRIGLSMLVAWLLAAALSWRHAAMPAALCGLALLELGAANFALLAPRENEDRMRWTREMRAHADVRNFLRSNLAPGERVWAEPSDLDQNWPAFHGFPGPAGYLASVSIPMADWPTHTANGRRLLATRYRLSKGAPGPDEETVFVGESGLRVHRDAKAFPPAWAVHLARGASPAEFDATVRDKLDELRTVALLPGGAATYAGCASQGKVDWMPDGRLRARMPCPGLVVIAATWFPGWAAEVDGRSAPVLRVNSALRAVPVDAGEHFIEMRYRPRPAYLGALLSAAGLCAAALIVFRSRTTS